MMEVEEIIDDEEEREGELCGKRVFVFSEKGLWIMLLMI